MTGDESPICPRPGLLLVRTKAPSMGGLTASSCRR